MQHEVIYKRIGEQNISCVIIDSNILPQSLVDRVEMLRDLLADGSLILCRCSLRQFVTEEETISGSSERRRLLDTTEEIPIWWGDDFSDFDDLAAVKGEHPPINCQVPLFPHVRRSKKKMSVVAHLGYQFLIDSIENAVLMEFKPQALSQIGSEFADCQLIVSSISLFR